MNSTDGILADAKAREAVISAVITRADGTVEQLGVISYWHKNPFKRWGWAIKKGISKWLLAFKTPA